MRPGETGRDRDVAYFQIDFKYLRNIFEIMFKKYRGRKSWGRIDFTPGGLKLAKYLFENQVQAFSLHAAYGSRSFTYAAPQIWNSLPIDLKMSPSIENFRVGLKTHLFKLAYPD